MGVSVVGLLTVGVLMIDGVTTAGNEMQTSFRDRLGPQRGVGVGIGPQRGGGGGAPARGGGSAPARGWG